jgi:hypothetical protein
MSEAIRRIVSAYVKLSNRKALEDLRAYRYRLVTELKSLSGTLDVTSSINQLETEIAIIDAGIAKLRPAAAA